MRTLPSAVSGSSGALVPNLGRVPVLLLAALLLLLAAPAISGAYAGARSTSPPASLTPGTPLPGSAGVPTVPRTTLNGVDTSHYQGSVNWWDVLQAGNSFAFTKAAEGESSGCDDSTFATNMQKANSVGLAIGGYDFAELPTGSVQACSTSDNATTEANTFLSVAGPYFKSGYMYPALDQEQGCPADGSGSLTAQQLSSWDGQWLSTVHNYILTNDGYNILPIIYTDSAEAGSCMEPWLTMYPLWIANYGVTSPNTGVWPSWAYWQYSSSGSVGGINGSSDVDYFNGGSTNLQSYIFGSGGGSTPPAASYAMLDENVGAALSCGGSFAVGDTINFTASVTGGTPPYTYAWTFGDGGTGTTNPVNHMYTAAGTVTPLLTVTDSLGKTGSTGTGCSFTVSGTLLSVSASATPTSGTAPLSVTFTGSATGGTAPYTWFWGFGDGAKSTAVSPTHTYTSAGSYVATVIVNDTAKHTATSSTATIAVSGSSALTVSAAGSPLSGTSPLTVAFTCTPSGGSGGDSYAWTFGDTGTSTLQNPSHTYTTSTAQTFSASVTVTDSLGTTAVSQTVSIQVAPAALPLTATASALPTTGNAPLSVQLTGGASGGTSPYTWFWTFGDGSAFSVAQNPAHTYSSAGNYTATLVVNDSAGHSNSASVLISVGSAPPSQLAVSASGPSSVVKGALATFTASPTGGTPPYTQFAWNFGDGGVSTTTTTSASHTYKAAGTFQVNVSVTDSAGARATSAPITVVVTLPTDGVILGQVRNASSNFLLSGATVKVSVLSTQQVVSTLLTGTNGSFRAPFGAGSYVVSVTAPSYQSSQQTVTVVGGSPVPVYFNLTWQPGSVGSSPGKNSTTSSTSGLFGLSSAALTTLLLLLGAILVVGVVITLVIRSRQRKQPPTYPPEDPNSAYAPSPQDYEPRPF